MDKFRKHDKFTKKDKVTNNTDKETLEVEDDEPEAATDGDDNGSFGIHFKLFRGYP